MKEKIEMFKRIQDCLIEYKTIENTIAIMLSPECDNYDGYEIDYELERSYYFLEELQRELYYVHSMNIDTIKELVGEKYLSIRI